MPNFNAATKEQCDQFIATYANPLESVVDNSTEPTITSMMDETLGLFPDNVVVKILSYNQSLDENDQTKAPDIQYLVRDFTPIDPANPWPGSRTYRNNN